MKGTTFGLDSHKLAHLLHLGLEEESTELAEESSSEVVATAEASTVVAEQRGGWVDDLAKQALESLFENYQILEELPRGGQAALYKAIHKPTKQKVALKVLLPTQVGSAHARRYFEREVDLAAGLDHPNIVRILDSGVSRGQYYFAMEYIRGQALDTYVEQAALGQKERVRLFAKICAAMSHAHQRGVIHRDLKPSNILVDERGEPRVLDFGLAKSATADQVSLMSVTGDLKGTVHYMSPEQAEGRSDRVDVRTDVYALGVILYRLLLDRFPYEVTGSTFEVLKTIQQQEPQRPRQVVSRFDTDLEAILLAALAKDPSQRYQSAAEFKHDLDCWLEHRPIVARSVSSWYLLRKIFQRHRQAAAIVGLLALIVLAFVFATGYLLNQTRQTQLERQSVIENASDSGRIWVEGARDLVMAGFLEAWWQDDMAGMLRAAHLFRDPESLEYHLVRFLGDPNAPATKEALYFGDLSESDRWLADFVIAEDYLKRGDMVRAEAHYGRAYQRWLALEDDQPSSVMNYYEKCLKSRMFERGLSRELNP